MTAMTSSVRLMKSCSSRRWDLRAAADDSILAVAVEPEPDVEEPASEMSTGTKSGTDVTAKVGAAEEGNGKKARTGPVKFYVGTDQCDLWEVTATSVRILIAGSGSALNDVAWNPRCPTCAPRSARTAGSSCGTRKNARSLRCATSAPGSPSTKSSGGGKSLHFSPDGKLLAAGLGDGRVVVMDARSLARLAEAQAGGGGLLNPADWRGPQAGRSSRRGEVLPGLDPARVRGCRP